MSIPLDKLILNHDKVIFVTFLGNHKYLKSFFEDGGIQYSSELWTSPDFEWLKEVRHEMVCYLNTM